MVEKRKEAPMPNAILPSRRLVAAGWLAMTSALLTVPWFLLVFAVGNEGEWARWAQGGMLAGGTLLYVFLMTTLKRLLNARHAFHRTDGVITLLVAANIVSALGEGSGLLLPSLERALAPFGVVMVVAIGILQVEQQVRSVSPFVLPDAAFLVLRHDSGVVFADRLHPNL